MTDLLSRLKAGETLVGDGAMGSLLMAGGLRPGECPESLNLTRPELTEKIARLYCEAGAEIVETNTFGGSPLKLSMHGLEERTEEINRAAVAAVRTALQGRGYACGSCGPTGKFLEPFGDTKVEEISRGFERQIGALVEAGVDAVCVETMTDLTEAKLAVKAAKSASGEIPVIATMTFDPTPRGFYTIMGVNIPQAAAGLAEAGADVIGSNCGNGIENMITIAREFRKQTDLPLIIQANAGLPRLEGERTVYPETPEFMAEEARKLMAAGVSVIGGCCGTTPEHTRALRIVVDEARSGKARPPQ
jgi:5-methyltetrahydrofolate--homocysteine methyltransferase